MTIPPDLPDYVVIRAHPDLPPDVLPPHIDGRWIDLRHIPAGTGLGIGDAVAVPCGRFEIREDGAVAEVWELRP